MTDFALPPLLFCGATTKKALLQEAPHSLLDLTDGQLNPQRHGASFELYPPGGGFRLVAVKRQGTNEKVPLHKQPLTHQQAIHSWYCRLATVTVLLLLAVVVVVVCARFIIFKQRRLDELSITRIFVRV